MLTTAPLISWPVRASRREVVRPTVSGFAAEGQFHRHVESRLNVQRLMRMPLVVAALMITVTACGSNAATPTVAPATNAPAVTNAANAPATADAAATAAAAGAAGQFCSGMKITFFPGGTAGGSSKPSSTTAPRLLKLPLARPFHPEWSDWDPNKMITQFQQAVATKPDGIAVMGHPGDAASTR